MSRFSDSVLCRSLYFQAQALYLLEQAWALILDKICSSKIHKQYISIVMLECVCEM